jgi:hypothetical protein
MTKPTVEDLEKEIADLRNALRAVARYGLSSEDRQELALEALRPKRSTLYRIWEDAGKY